MRYWPSPPSPCSQARATPGTWMWSAYLRLALTRTTRVSVNRDRLPPLTEDHIGKRKQLCLLASLESSQGVSGKIAEPQEGQAGTFQISTMPKIRASLIPEQSLEVFLRGGIAVVKNGTTGLLSNGLVTQVGGRVFLRLGAAANKDSTDEVGELDYATIVTMLREFTGMRFQYSHKDGTLKEIMYPVYMDNLFGHLDGTIFVTNDHKASFKARAQDRKYAIFLRCHPTFLCTAVRGVALYYVRIYNSTSDLTVKQDFDNTLTMVCVPFNWSTTLFFFFLALVRSSAYSLLYGSDQQASSGSPHPNWPSLVI